MSVEIFHDDARNVIVEERQRSVTKFYIVVCFFLFNFQSRRRARDSYLSSIIGMNNKHQSKCFRAIFRYIIAIYGKFSC
jgi:hypothetical protein